MAIPTPNQIVPLGQIIRDRGLQARVKISQAKVREYADKMADGEQFPPVELFRDEKDPNKYWIGDGWHRLLSAESLALPGIESNVRTGGRRAALRYALGANDTHGLPRSNADKHRAVELALHDEELRRLSDRQIADIVKVSHFFVGKKRRQLESDSSSGGVQGSFDDLRMGADGKVRRRPRRVSRPSEKGENRADSFSRGAGGATEPSDSYGNSDGFNIVKESFELEQLLREKMKEWPEDKRHSLCVLLWNVAVDHDPEIAEMTKTAFEELFERDTDRQEP